jgi:hypothetical protein
MAGHERDDDVANRIQFCRNYLTELEPYCNRWIQVSISEAMTIKDLDIGLGHSYFDIVVMNNASNSTLTIGIVSEEVLLL